jgi:hypothetical protein
MYGHLGGSMPKRSALRYHWPALLIVIIFALILVAKWLFPSTSSLGSAADDLLTVAVLLTALAQYAYHKIEVFRLAANRVRLLILNPESTWTLSAEFRVDNPRTAFQEINSALQHHVKSRSDRLSDSPTKTVWNVNGCTVKVWVANVSDPIEGDRRILRIDLPSVKRGFRELNSAIGNEVAPLMNRIEEIIKPEHRKFTVGVRFPVGNPYFGLFVANLNQDAISRFDIEYFESDTVEDDVVTVHRDSIVLITSTLRAAERLSLHYLSLQPVSRS